MSDWLERSLKEMVQTAFLNATREIIEDTMRDLLKGESEELIRKRAIKMIKKMLEDTLKTS